MFQQFRAAKAKQGLAGDNRIYHSVTALGRRVDISEPVVATRHVPYVISRVRLVPERRRLITICLKDDDRPGAIVFDEFSQGRKQRAELQAATMEHGSLRPAL